MGVETHCFAWDTPESVCKLHSDYFYDISVLDKDKILAVCRDIAIDGITTIATDICVPTISYVSEALKLQANSYDTSLCATNKALMRQRFQDKSVPSPRFVKVNGQDLIEKIEMPFPLIVKPTDRSGSLGVAKVFDKKELIEALNEAFANSLEGAAIVEEFIDGPEVSVEYISWLGEHFFLAITDKVTTGPPHFVELAHHQPGQFSEEKAKQIKEVTEKALDSLGITCGASHTELKICPDGRVVVVEVGARMGGDFIGSHLVTLSTGYDFLQGVIECALACFIEPEVTQKGASGIFFLCKETESVMPYFSGTNSFDIEKKILKDTLVSVSSSNDRSGYLIYRSENRITL